MSPEPSAPASNAEASGRKACAIAEPMTTPAIVPSIELPIMAPIEGPACIGRPFGGRAREGALHAARLAHLGARRRARECGRILGGDPLTGRGLLGEGDVDLVALLGRELRERLGVHRLDRLGRGGAQQVAVALDGQFVLAQLPCLGHGLRRRSRALVGCAEQSVQEAHGVLVNRSGDDQSTVASLEHPESRGCRDGVGHGAARRQRAPIVGQVIRLFASRSWHTGTRPAKPSRRGRERVQASRSAPSMPGRTARDPVMDLVRVLCVVVVVIGHMLMIGAAVVPGRGLVIERTLLETNWIGPVTWIAQIMPLFFVVGGFVGIGAWRRIEASGGTAADFIRSRILRLARPSIALFAALAVGVLVMHLTGVDPESDPAHRHRHHIAAVVPRGLLVRAGVPPRARDLPCPCAMVDARDAGRRARWPATPSGSPPGSRRSASST